MDRGSFVGQWIVGSSGRSAVVPEKSILTIELSNQLGGDFDVHIQPEAAKKVRLTGDVRFDDSCSQVSGVIVHSDTKYHLFLSQCNGLSSSGKKVIFGTLFPSEEGSGEDGGATGGWSAEETEGSGGNDG